MTTSIPEVKAVEATDERALFEAAIADKYPNMPLDFQTRFDGSIEYKSAGMQHRWRGWSDRAALSTRAAAPSATLTTPGTPFMVGMDSLLRHYESFEGGKVGTKAIREYILSFQPAAQPLQVSGAPMDEVFMLKREIHNLKRHIEDYCPVAVSGAVAEQAVAPSEPGFANWCIGKWHDVGGDIHAFARACRASGSAQQASGTVSNSTAADGQWMGETTSAPVPRMDGDTCRTCNGAKVYGTPGMPCTFCPIATQAATVTATAEAPVAWAVVSKKGGIHKLAITRESAERKASAWKEEWPNNGCEVRPLVFGAAAIKAMAPVGAKS